MPAMIAAALASLCLLQDAPSAPAPAAPPPAAAPAATPATDAPAAPATTPATDAPSAPAKPRQVWVFIDRWKEFGGTVVEEREAEFTVEGAYGERRSFNRNQVLDVIELVHPEPGQRGIVQLRDGTIVRGEIIRDALDEVEFRVDSIKGTLPREKVYRVVLELDFETRYRRIRASILPEEHGRRVALARWLAENDRLDLAVEELEALLREADSDAARDLLREVNARLTLQKSIEESKRRERERRAAQDSSEPKAAEQPAGAPPADAPPSRAMPTNRDMLPDNLISDEEVNLVRVYEIDFKDPPRLSVKPEGIRQLILRYGSSDLIPASSEERNLLYTKPAIEVVRLMFSLRARDLYRYIEVDEDPGSLALFRTRVHNSWLTANCATSRCHGGLHAGRFFLHTGNAKDQRIRYTNLLALLDFEVDGKPMVDFEDPPSSLLVQYAMPRNMARYPHPQVNGWKPVFSKSTPQLLSDTLEWIRGMYRPRPEYPVEYRRPDLDAPDKAVPSPDGPDR